jgi:DNA-binding GntR family transcriptional regulator
MGASNQRLARALKEKDAVTASGADHDFHFALIRRSENPELIKILEDLKVNLRRLEVAYFQGRIVAERSVTEHKSMLSALKKRDIQSAADRVEANWRNSLERLARHTRDYPAWPSP